MSFTHVQGKVAATAGSGSPTTLAVVLNAAPTAGNLVCVAFCPGVSVTGLTVKDANNNSYTVTPLSPSTFQTGCGQVWLAYLLSAPANASATINLSWTTTAQTAPAWVDEFSFTGGSAAFDLDVANNTGVAGTTINTPSITPAGAGELLFAGAAAGGTISAPVAGGASTNGVWTGAAGAITSGDMAEYRLSSSSGATAVNYTQSSGAWSGMAMALKIVASFTPDEDFSSSLKMQFSDPAVSVWQ
jgi:hypothetical protein